MSDCMVRGQDTQVLLYDESAYNTEPGVPSAILAYFTSMGLSAEQSNINDDSITTHRTRQEPARGNINPSGALACVVAAENIGFLMRHAMGAVATSGTDPYSHVLTPGALPVGMHVEKDYGSKITGAGRVERFGGVRVNSMGLEFPTEGFVTANFDLIGASHSLESSALDASPTDLGHTGFTIFDGAIEEGGSAIAIVENASINLSNNLDGSGYVIGSAGERVCMPEGFAEISGSLTAHFKDAALLTKAVNGAESSLKITLSRGDGLGSAGNESIEFFVNHLKYDRASPSIDGPNGIKVSLNFTAFRSGSDLGFQVTLKNALSALSA